MDFITNLDRVSREKRDDTLRNLCANLTNARYFRDLHRVLLQETDTGRNAWYEAKEHFDYFDSYLADLRLGLRAVEEDPSRPASEDYAHQVQYALMIASIDSLARNVPAPLLLVLAHSGIWSPPRALSVARQNLDPRERVWALSGLVPLLSGTERGEVLEEARQVAREIGDRALQAEWLVRLGQAADALALAAEMEEQGRATTLRSLAGQLAQHALDTATGMARALSSVEERTALLGWLAGYHLEERQPAIWREILGEVAQLHNPRVRARIVVRLAPLLPAYLLEETLGLVSLQTIANADTQFRTWLDAFVSGTSRSPRMREQIEKRRWDLEIAVGEALCALAPYLPPSLWRRAWEEARDLHYEIWRKDALEKLGLHRPSFGWRRYFAPLLPWPKPLFGEEQRREEARVHEMSSGAPLSLRHNLSVRWPYLLKSGLRKRLHELHALAQAPIGSAPQTAGHTSTSETQPPDTEADRLDLLLSQTDPDEFVLLYEQHGTVLSVEFLATILAEKRRIGDEALFVRALAKLDAALAKEAAPPARSIRQPEAGHAVDEPGAEVRQLVEAGEYGTALARIQAMETKKAKLKALRAIGPSLPPAQKSEAYDLAQSLLGEYDYGIAAQVLTPLRTTEQIESALTETAQYDGLERRMDTLGDMAPYLEEPQLRRALAIAQEIEEQEYFANYRGYHAETLARLIPYLAQVGHPDEALKRAGQLSEEGIWMPARSAALKMLASELSRLGHPEKAVTAALSIEDAGRRQEALVRLAPELAQSGHVDQALLVAGEVETRDLERVISRMAPHLSAEALPTAMEALNKSGDPERQAVVTAALAADVATRPLQTIRSFWQSALFPAGQQDNSRARLIPTLEGLTPVMVAAGGTGLLEAAKRALERAGRWWP